MDYSNTFYFCQTASYNSVKSQLSTSYAGHPTWVYYQDYHAPNLVLKFLKRWVSSLWKQRSLCIPCIVPCAVEDSSPSTLHFRSDTEFSPKKKKKFELNPRHNEVNGSFSLTGNRLLLHLMWRLQIFIWFLAKAEVKASVKKYFFFLFH